MKLFVTTNPRGGPPAITDFDGLCDIVEATARVDRARRELSEAEWAEQEAREKAALPVQEVDCGR